MKSNHLQVLRSICRQPKNTKYFCDGTVESFSTPVAENILRRLAEDGLIEQINTLWHVTEDGRKAVEDDKVAEPRTIVNGAQTEYWKPKAWVPARASGSQHLQFSSRGF